MGCVLNLGLLKFSQRLVDLSSLFGHLMWVATCEDWPLDSVWKHGPAWASQATFTYPLVMYHSYGKWPLIYSGFSHLKSLFSIAMLNYQGVISLPTSTLLPLSWPWTCTENHYQSRHETPARPARHARHASERWLSPWWRLGSAWWLDYGWNACCWPLHFYEHLLSMEVLMERSTTNDVIVII